MRTINVVYLNFKSAAVKYTKMSEGIRRVYL